MHPRSDPNQRAEREPAPWSATETADHLRILNDDAADGRATGSVGFGHVAAYLASRLREYGLQPVAPGSWRHLYFTPLNSVNDARVVRFGADTLSTGGEDGLEPDPRSAAGSVRAKTVDLIAAGAPISENPAPVIVIGPSDTGTVRLRAWASAGVRAVIAATRPTPGRETRPLGDLLLIRADPSLVSRLVDAPMNSSGPTESARLPLDLGIEVAGSFNPAAGAINIMGYIGGRDPYLASELVIVAASVDGSGSIGPGTGPDASEYGVAAAAVLESARVLAGLARAGEAPDRTVLFALLSGSRQDQAGARAWLKNPTWPSDATRVAILVGESDPGVFGSQEYPVLVLGSDSVATGPGSLESRGASQAASLAREVLLMASRHVWSAEGPSRVPSPGM